MNKQTWLVDVKKTEDGELFIEIPVDAMAQADIKIGDELTMEEDPVTHDIHLVKSLTPRPTP